MGGGRGAGGDLGPSSAGQLSFGKYMGVLDRSAEAGPHTSSWLVLWANTAYLPHPGRPKKAHMGSHAWPRSPKPPARSHCLSLYLLGPGVGHVGETRTCGPLLAARGSTRRDDLEPTHHTSKRGQRNWVFRDEQGTGWPWPRQRERNKSRGTAGPNSGEDGGLQGG